MSQVSLFSVFLNLRTTHCSCWERARCTLGSAGSVPFKLWVFNPLLRLNSPAPRWTKQPRTFHRPPRKSSGTKRASRAAFLGNRADSFLTSFDSKSSVGRPAVGFDPEKGCAERQPIPPILFSVQVNYRSNLLNSNSGLYGAGKLGIIEISRP